MQTTDLLTQKADQYAHLVYEVTKKLPKDELYGVTSQLRRAALSVPLNIIEGYARQAPKVHKQFLQIAYGSLKESQYLLDFIVKENYVQPENIKQADELGVEVAKQLWTKLKNLSQTE